MDGSTALDAYDYASGHLLLTGGQRVHLPRTRKILFEHLLRIKPRAATNPELALLLYGGTDGPIDESNTVSVHIHHLVKDLRCSTIQLHRSAKRDVTYWLAGEVRQLNKPKAGECPLCGHVLPRGHADG